MTKEDLKKLPHYRGWVYRSESERHGRKRTV